MNRILFGIGLSYTTKLVRKDLSKTSEEEKKNIQSLWDILIEQKSKEKYV